MLTTAELRWFCRGEIPDAIAQWFASDSLGVHLAPSEEREDVYLYIPASDFVGIKLRQARLEIKWRNAELGVLQVGQVVGKAEKWRKWLCEDHTKESFLASEVTGKAWVSVKKKRTQQKYQVTSQQSVVAIPIEQSGDRICSVELTQLELYHQAWWSLAFEASGKAEFETLKLVAEFISQSNADLKLQLEDSYAYPHWLDRNYSISQQT